MNKKKFQACADSEKASVALLLLDIIVMAKCAVGHKGQYIMIKIFIPLDNIKIINMCDSNSLRYM